MNRSRQRKIPLRTCVACREVRAKRDLVRIVRLVDGSVIVDATGKKSGRGAYLCRQRTCWDAAFQRGVLERALKQSIPSSSRAELAAFAASLPEHLAARKDDSGVEAGPRETEPSSTS